MTNTKTGRRRLLKTVAVSSSVLVAGKYQPETWMKPVVNSILLPAHASTTNDNGNLPVTTQPPSSCVGISRTIGSDMAGIAIEFDGVSSPTLVQVQSFSYRSNNTIIMVSKIPDFAVGRGDSWSPNPSKVENGVNDGIYTRSSTRLVGDAIGNTYDITFCISTSGSDNSRTLTVVLVSAVKV